MSSIYDLVEIVSTSGVNEAGEPFVHLRATTDGDTVLIGQLDPAATMGLARDLMATAVAAEGDAALYRMMCERLPNDPDREAKAAAIIRDLREYRVLS